MSGGVGKPDSEIAKGSAVGESVLRYGGAERVSGEQKYLSDLEFPDTCHVAFTTIESGCAQINSVDTSVAKQLPGVVAVVTADDLPSNKRFGISHQDRPLLATQTVNFHGEPVAAVVAESEEVARAAASLVSVDFSQLDGVYTLDDALADGARLVQEPEVRPGDERNNTNVIDAVEYEWGDVAADEASADVVVSDTYTFPMVTHFPIEPGGVIA